MRIAFIGGGNMATALIGGIFAAQGKTVTIAVADPNPEARRGLEKQWPVDSFSQPIDAIKGADAIVLAVKPQVLPIVLEEIGPHISSGQVVISIVAGIEVRQIAAAMKSAAIVRTMPNTPALIGLGITALYANDHCTASQRRLAENLMKTAGEIVWLQQEKLLDVVTAVSGSGPAYFFYLIEAMQMAGSHLGLPADIAKKLALHTAHGASVMAVQSDVGVVELRNRVTSKGGTTQAALEALQQGGFVELIDSAILAATNRAQQLAAMADHQ